MSDNSFSLIASQQFDIQMNSKQWRMDTFNQLSKDFQLSGVSIESVSEEFDLTEIMLAINDSIQSVKSNKQQWDNLNYRIDLPTKIDIDCLSIEEASRLFLLRCFQKVWIRKHYSNSISKDDVNDIEEHLKP
ncbi:MAG TPA: hypothetical protein DCR48_12050 [Flavobacteriales bacterium]|nr:hypothetical protein [Flavobacteriales bacterium]